jgi:hypothetical protein
VAREALLIGNAVYDDIGLRRLRAPSRDVEALAGVLSDPEVGLFQTEVVVDQLAAQVRVRIEQFFADRRPDDQLVLYFSGHGLKDATGALYLAAKDTRITDLTNTSVTADFINSCVHKSRSRRVLLVLDCCYSGAFPRGIVLRADRTVHAQERFTGRGVVIITASSAIEYAFEDGALAEEIEPRPSVFTHALIEGLDTGAADLDRDGEITVDEIYDYAFDAVHDANPSQTPCRWVLGAQGRLVIGRQRASAPPPPVRSTPAPSPIKLRPPRRLGALAAAPLVAGGALAWFGLQWFILSVLFAGGLLIIGGFRLLVASQLGSTELSRDGVRVHRLLTARVRWPSILAIEVRPTLTGHAVALRRADTAVLHRLTLPAPYAGRFTRNTEFADHVQVIRRWSERWGSPAPVLSSSRWMAARSALAAIVGVATLLLAVDRPWTWAPGPEAERVPNACAVLDKDAATEVLGDQVVGYFTIYNISDKPGIDRVDQQSSQCRWNVESPYTFGIGGPVGYIELRYERHTGDFLASGTGRAEQQLEDDRRHDSASGLNIQPPTAQLGNANIAQSIQDNQRTLRIRTQRANVIVTVEFNSSKLDLPDATRIEKFTATAIRSITLRRSWLR